MLVGNHSFAEGRAADDVHSFADTSHLLKEEVAGAALVGAVEQADHL